MSQSNVAVIGLACEFPGARNLEEFWSNLKEGRECISHFTEKELADAGVRADRLTQANYVRSKGVIQDVDLFDHQHFGIEPDRACLMDPQHRVFMQKCWEALEDAGCDPMRYRGVVGMFAGAALNTYVLNNLRHAPREMSRKFSSIEYLLMTDKDFLSTQTSFHLGLTGPSVTIQSACSTSLSAVHLACQSLLNGECEVAVAGAVTIYCPQVKGYLYEPNSIISRDGHVRPFDVDGSGTVYSSGVGVVILKPLDQAVADGDQIYAVIKSTAINNDGARKASFNPPSVDGIRDVAVQALALSAVPVSTIGMVEANGSGTRLGDPIEIEALSKAYGQANVGSQSIPIGSVKGNIGHMNVAAGMGALLKAIACVKFGKIPPSINFREANPLIDFAKSPFLLSTHLRDWPIEGYPRRVGVNVYGVGGTNGHAIIEQAPAREEKATERRYHLLMVSASSEESLDRQVVNLEKLLSGGGDRIDLGDAALTLASGRRQLRCRAAAVLEGSRMFPSKFEMRWIRSDRDDTRSGCCVVFPKISCDWEVTWSRLSGQSVAFSTAMAKVKNMAPDLFHPRFDDHASSPNAHALDAVAEFATGFALYAALRDCGLGKHQTYGAETGAITALCVGGHLELDYAIDIVRQLAYYRATSGQRGSPHFEGLRTRRGQIPFFSALSHGGANIGAPFKAEEALHGVLGTPLAEDALIANVSENGLLPLRLVPPSPEEGSLEVALLKTVARVWVGTSEGVELEGYYAGEERARVRLPTYPFARSRHWVDIPANAGTSNYDVAL